MSQLEGLRVWLTRPRSDADSSATKWRAQGATVLVLPLLEIVPLELDPSRRQRLGEFDPQWFVLSSANAAEHLVRALGGSGSAHLQGRVAALGEKTARRARALGLDVDLVASRATAPDLARELLAQPGARRFVLPGGNLQRPDLSEALSDGGGQVLALTLYETRAVAPLPGELASALAEGLDLVAFYSPSAVHSLVALDDPGSARKVPAAALGSTTAEAVRKCGLPLVACPADPGEGNLLEEVSRWWKRRR